MKKFISTLIMLLLFPLLFLQFLSSQSPNADLVIIESRDEKGTLLTRGVGVVQKNGFVICNYHLVAGGRKIRAFVPGSAESWLSDGYLSVSESKDLVVLSFPGLEGKPAAMFRMYEVAKGSEVTFAQVGGANSVSFRRAIVKGSKEINGIMVMEAVSTETDECISGPLFYKGELAGLVTAGYFDGKYYLYAIPIKHLFPIIGASFIIKSFDSFDDELPVYKSRYQSSLLDLINQVLWLSFEDAVRLSKKNERKVIVDICTNWNGWCNMMDNQVYNQRSIIKYINENYYAVKLDAESKDTIFYQGRMFAWDPVNRCHALAYSLLEGKMNYPGTAFLDEEINLLTVVPGFMDVRKMKVALHFFKDEAYRKAGLTFEAYEASFVDIEE